MSIFLAVVVVTIKSWCPHGLGPVLLCLVSLFFAFVIVTLVLGFVLLIGLPTLAYLSSVSLFTTKMTSGFRVLTFFTPLLCTF